ncbi:MAG: transcriptional regulator [Planctomycetales bacterium 4484_113]|nr:MAG: transcriptional regulator [Planctomycetales bacterium 4484_113]
MGPFCQSCAMPMEKPEDFGTNADGGRNDDYCCYCFKDGEFTEPDITMEQMTEKVIDIMVKQMNMAEAQVKPMMRAMIPQLKRWRRA